MAELKSFIPPAVAAAKPADAPAPVAQSATTESTPVPAGTPAKAPKVKARKFAKAPTPDEVKAHEAESQAGLDQIMSSMLEDHGMTPDAEQTSEHAQTPVETPVVEQKPTASAQAKPTKTLANLAIKMGLPESTVNSMTDEQLTPVVEALYERNLAAAGQKPPEQPKQPEPELGPQIDSELMFDAQWIEDNSVPDHLTRPITKMAERLVKLEKMNEELLKHLQADQGRKNFETVHNAFGKLEGPLKGMFGEAPKAGSPELERRMMVLHSLKQRPIPGNLPLHQQIQIRASELLPVPQAQTPPQDPAVVELERRKQLWKEGTVANPVNAAPAANDDVARAQQEIDRLWNQHFRNG